MERLLEFVLEHYVLVSSFSGLLILLMLTESRRGGANISPQAVVNLINKQNAKVIDLRPEADFRAGHITDAINIPVADIAKRMQELEGLAEAPIILVCAMGQSAGTVGRQLRAKGIETVTRLSGGMGNWQAEKLPVVKS